MSGARIVLVVTDVDPVLGVVPRRNPWPHQSWRLMHQS